MVYYWLPSALESVSVREVGELVLFNLRTAAIDRQRAGLEQRKVYLLIDECQKVVGENSQEILQAARSFGISTVLANQSLNDLNTASFDLRSTIRTNTGVKMFFSLTEPDEIRNMIAIGGEEIHCIGDEEREQVGSRLSAKEIAYVSDHPQRLYLLVSSGAGYTQFGGLPVPVQTDWPITLQQVRELEREPWPDLHKSTVQTSVPPAAPPPQSPAQQPTPASVPKQKKKPKALKAATAAVSSGTPRPKIVPTTPPAAQAPSARSKCGLGWAH